MIAPAFVNHGRWVVLCGCHTGVRVFPPDPLTSCPACRMQIRVQWPNGWRSAEAVLDQRPDPRNRNWVPSLEAAAVLGTMEAETVDDLRRENLEHGLDYTPDLGGG